MFGAKSGGLTGKKALAIIFLVVGIMLMFFIISQGTSVYKTSREDSDRQGLSSLQCVGFLYTVSGIAATAEELQFTFRNEMSSTEDVHNLTVSGYDSKSQTFPVSILAGSSMAVRVPVKVIDNFTVYPDSCSVFPAACNTDGECSYH